MDIKIFLTVFLTVFLAELGDKTQLATMLFATDKAVSKWLVFAAASLALVACSAIGVLAGDWVSQQVSERALKLIAGGGFMLIGAWVLMRAVTASS